MVIMGSSETRNYFIFPSRNGFTAGVHKWAVKHVSHVEMNSCRCLGVTTRINDKWISDQYGQPNTLITEGDNIIDMWLDLDSSELGFSLNDKYYGKAFNVDAGFEYVGAVSFGREGQTLTVLAHDSATPL